MEDKEFQSYATPFKRHLAFFDRNNDGYIFFGESLRGNLALGFDFPVALVLATGYQMAYGNVRPIYFGPLRGIEISKVDKERSMLQTIDLSEVSAEGLDRKSLVDSSGANSLIDKLHVNGVYALSANYRGLVPARDIERVQHGTILYEIERRRKGRADILPLTRGGPISVTGHSWFVDKLFGVKVYQKDGSRIEK